MTFLELAKERYSVRSFKSCEIEEKKINRILEAAAAAPTACNYQPQKIYLVKAESLREKLKEVCPCTFDAPVIAVIGYDKTRDWKNKRMPGYSSGETDAAIVCTHMMLEAWELGIGTCWVGMFKDEEIRTALNLPENIQITALLPMGYPKEDSKPIELHFKSRENEDMVTIL